MSNTFEGLWPGGYYEGDPLDPKARSSYGDAGYISILHATYLRCVKPYVNPGHNALEIGPGRGAWTHGLLPFKQVHVLEVLSEKETHIFEHLGYRPYNLIYHQVTDFSCKELPDEYFNYMFSFGCMCHIPFAGIHEYAKNLYGKMRQESNCFWAISDYATAHLPPDKDEEPRPGRWYNNDMYRVRNMLEDIGYTVYDINVGTAVRDPIIWFGRR